MGFRGHCSPEYKLIPSVGRSTKYSKTLELRLFEDFKKKAISLIADPRLDEWDWLAYAQHIGVPTRLLDWTTSPLNAAFFALEKDNNEDRNIYCMKFSSFLHEVDTTLQPLENEKVGRFTPRLLLPRIRAQRGVFSIHPNPQEIYINDKLRVLTIPSKNVKNFKRRLFKYGMDYWHIYPDAEGLAQQLKWQFENGVGFGRTKSSL